MSIEPNAGKTGISIAGIGSFLPPKIVHSTELDARLGRPLGWSEHKSGIVRRHWAAEGDCLAAYCASAARQALNMANLRPGDLDCIIGACGIPQQPIPCMGALIQRELGLGSSGIPGFDVNLTCYSFVQGLEIASLYIQTGRYRRILVCSGDIASFGLDFTRHDNCILFGDGAAAAVVTAAIPESSSTFRTFRTFMLGDGCSHAQIIGGGSRLHASHFSEANQQDFLFQMDGRKLYEICSRHFKAFFESALQSAGVTREELTLIIPHQASGPAISLISQKLSLPDSKVFNIIGETGNTVSAAIPMALDQAVRSGRVRRGDLIALIGVSAGVSLGVAIIEY